MIPTSFISWAYSTLMDGFPGTDVHVLRTFGSHVGAPFWKRLRYPQRPEASPSSSELQVGFEFFCDFLFFSRTLSQPLYSITRSLSFNTTVTMGRLLFIGHENVGWGPLC